MPFQTTVNSYVAPGLEGGWASFNPYVSLLPPQTGDLSLPNAGAWRAGATGATIGRFAWADTTTGNITSAHPGFSTFVEGTTGGPGRVRLGFIQRDNIVLITPYLAETGSTVPAGVEITAITRGDVWARFAAGAPIGSFVFASYADGSAIAGATSTAPTATGVTVTTTNGSANLTAVTGGTLAAGQPVSGTGIPAGAYIVSVSGTTAVLSANATASGTGIAVTQTTAFLTQWRVDSLAANGELAKISVWG